MKNNSNVNKIRSIAAVVVTYNRKGMLKVCLSSILNQTKKINEIIVIDNASTDGSDKEILKLFPNITYVRKEKNLGGAGGFYEGIKLAYKKKYDWIWIMDDDVAPVKSCLDSAFKSLDSLIKKTDISALACARYNPDGSLFVCDAEKINLQNPFKNIFLKPIAEEPDAKCKEIEAATFENMIINSRAIKSIGFPDRRFFIRCDDVDYCLRLLKFGKIYYCHEAKINRLNEYNGKLTHDDWKYYYQIRNLNYIVFKYGSIPLKIKHILIITLVFTRSILLPKKNKFKFIKVYYKSINDMIKMLKEKYNYFN